MSDFVPAQHLARDGDRMNLAVLQRIDKAVDKILFSAGHTALYGYNTDTRQWASKDVEGSTFLVQRTTAPFYQLLVLNKKSTNNFKEAIDVDAFQFEVSGPYIMYENAEREVGGMWLYDTKLIPLMVAALEGMKAAHVALQAQRQAAQAISSGAGGNLGAPQPAAPAAPSQGAEAAFWAMLGQAAPTQSAPQPLLEPPLPAATGTTPPAAAANDNLARLFGSAKPAPSPAPLPSQTHSQNPPGYSQAPPSPQKPLAMLPAASPSPQKPHREAQIEPLLPGLQPSLLQSPTPAQMVPSQGQSSLLDEPQMPGPSSAPSAAPAAGSAGSASAAKTAGAAPAAAAPDLLTPSFFRQSANLGASSSPPRESMLNPTITTRAQSHGQQAPVLGRPTTSSAAAPASPPADSQPVQQPQQQPARTGDGLSHLFARAKGVQTTPSANGGAPSATGKYGDATRPPDVPGDQQSSDSGGGRHSRDRDAVRAAIHALADDDEFIALVANKLQSVLQP